ncbi:PHB depolymerase family esterase [Micromonospora sp. WMMD1120]|uniref:extracellular catalytic domain type 1 short-chain-length polyhydroxyalkanoate depolymerase n=1 Tax=Micromonospora sp. WMMD1120 TaxID=3016106 RepID=UPI002416FE86|nr:PHB depolymerase family esterase [Micromonospora sp. WMMD1120]MDG4810531.1 PHB depolymerase family esterase [Micromonospora sp. WMMD1120]
MTLKTRMLGVLMAVVAVAAAALTVATPASAATLTQVTSFGSNPTNLQMHLYVPDRVAARPAVLLAMHYCTGTGPAFYSGTQYASLADRYGFIVIYPSATRSSRCWDVYSPQALRRGGGSDPVGLMSMVDHVKQRYSADPTRIFATGTSSGAMMTNVMLGVYPDVFAAGASFAGVPFACFATGGTSEWNSQCANGQLIRTAQQWGDLVREAYPGYTGQRPRMQVWHGTNDDTLRYPNFGEQVKQWTNVHGLSQTPTYTDTPQSGYTRTRYGGNGPLAPVEAISMQGVTHNIPVDAAQVIRFFGLDGAAPPTTPPPTTPPPTTPPPTTPPPSGGGCRVAYTVNAWNTGLTASVAITNTGSSVVSGWELTFTLPTGQRITSGWNAQYAPASGAVTARNVSYNATIAPNAAVEIGFQATHEGGTGKPSSFALNGTACAVS